MKITVIGCGYVGLVTGACLAKLGHEITCVDKNADKIAALRCGECPIYEPGLIELLKSVKFSTGITHNDIIFICVGTPQNMDGSCDISQVLDVARHIGNAKTVLVTKSTVPVGAGKKIAKLCPNASVVSNPEFLREGQAIHDFMHPDRIVIGGDPIPSAAVGSLYTGIDAPILYTNSESAELIKYASNGFLAMKLAYINELSWLAEETGADINHVTKGMGMDKRIGPDYLKVGPGFGGSCFPKDLAALRSMSPDLKLISQTIDSNCTHQLRLADKINAMCSPDSTIGVLGTAFKANTDDTRESPALTIIGMLHSRIKTYDPKATCTHTFEECLACDYILILTEWDEFRDFETDKPVIDLRGVYKTSQSEPIRGISAPIPLVRQYIDCLPRLDASRVEHAPWHRLSIPKCSSHQA